MVIRTGNARNNFLYGTAERDTLDGGAGNDYLRGYQGDDLLTGGTGADRFVFERTFAANGTDLITDFEAGADILDFSLVGFARGVFNTQDLSSLVRIEQNETGARLLIDLDGGGDSFQTWARLDGLKQGDQVSLQVGARTLTAEVAPSPLQILSFAASGPAQLAITANKAAVAQLYLGGSGSLGESIGGSVNLVANEPGTLGVAAQASVTAAELRLLGEGGSGTSANTLIYLGTNGSDAITGSGQADILFGFDGADTLTGGAGADTVYAGTGNDTIHGGAGDVLYGEAGNDRFSFDEGAGVMVASAASIVGGDGTDEIFAWSGHSGGNVTLGDAAFASASGLEVLTLSALGTGSVTLGAHAGAAFGGGITVTNAIASGALVVNGAAATVAIIATGGNGADNLRGGSANDTLIGGAGADTIDGGEGTDTYHIAQSGFNSWDTITVTDGDVFRSPDSGWSFIAPVVSGIRSATGDYGSNDQLMGALATAIDLPAGINKTYLVQVQDNQTTPGVDFSGYYLVSEFVGSTTTIDGNDIVVKLVGIDGNASISFTGVDTLSVSLGLSG